MNSFFFRRSHYTFLKVADGFQKFWCFYLIDWGFSKIVVIFWDDQRFCMFWVSLRISCTWSIKLMCRMTNLTFRNTVSMTVLLLLFVFMSIWLLFLLSRLLRPFHAFRVLVLLVVHARCLNFFLYCILLSLLFFEHRRTFHSVNNHVDLRQSCGYPDAAR